MEFDVFAAHIAFALTMFLVLNWIGKHAQTSGYLTLTLFLERDEAPAFNFIFRAFGPVIFVILLASALYVVDQDRFVNRIWLVTAYYFIGRLIYNLTFGRFLLMNWGREAILLGTSVGLSWLLYEQVIREKQNLLPDFTHVSNHLWGLIFLFLYATLNNIRFSDEATKRRKNRYLHDQYSVNKQRYQEIIQEISPNQLVESLIYTILIYESFNRPYVARALERILKPWGSRSLGPMQVTTDRRITDEESVRRGANLIQEAYQKAIVEGEERAAKKGVDFDPMNNSSHRMFIESRVAAAYNRDDDYVSEVRRLHDALTREFYPVLNPPPSRMSDYYI